ncbi:MAG: hypothetical protein LBM67_02555 [Lentimicrobiaceae bacterium]|jgi:hypothetical protein|nr:hypothetical protein [Lentimicrobiaceae bacterium]
MKPILISFFSFLFFIFIKINTLHSQTCVYCTGSSVNNTSSSIGGNNTLSGTYSTAIGRYLSTTTKQSIVIGSGAYISGITYPLVNNIANSLMIGFGRPDPTIFVSSGSYSPIGGQESLGKVGIQTINPEAILHVNGDFQVGTGAIFVSINNRQAKVRLYNSISALGINNVSDSAVSFGKGNESSGLFSFVSGLNSVATNEGSVSFGRDNQSIGKHSFVTGLNSVASEEQSVAMGLCVASTAPASFAMGRFVKATASNSFIIGGGLGPNNYLTNNNTGSFMVGFNSNKPTFFVEKAPAGGSRTGKVGIGDVAAPTAKLHIKADSQEPATLRLEATGTSTNAYSHIYLTNDHAIRAAASQHFYFTTPTNKHFIFENGNVGIGVANPTSKLHISGDVNATGSLTVGSNVVFTNLKSTESKMLVVNTNGTLSSETIPIGSGFDYTATQNINMNGYLIVNGTAGTNGIFVTTNGSVGIGTTVPGNYKLSVKGGIIAESIKIVQSVPASDFVFLPDYKLMPLSELETYVKTHHHLPEVPSAETFIEEGYDIGRMDDLLLRKVEELTLYIIQQQKEIEALKQQLQEKQ